VEDVQCALHEKLFRRRDTLCPVALSCDGAPYWPMFHEDNFLLVVDEEEEAKPSNSQPIHADLSCQRANVSRGWDFRKPLGGRRETPMRGRISFVKATPRTSGYRLLGSLHPHESPSDGVGCQTPKLQWRFSHEASPLSLRLIELVGNFLLPASGACSSCDRTPTRPPPHPHPRCLKS